MNHSTTVPFAALGGASFKDLDAASGPHWPTWGHLIRQLDVSPLPYLDTSNTDLILDATFGKGVFWNQYDPLPTNLVTNDIDPDRDVDERWDWLLDPPPRLWMSAFQTVLFDPPFKLSGTNRIMLARYGLDDDATNKQRTDGLLVGALNVAQTVRPGGWLLVKCQPQVAGGRVRWQPRLVANMLEEQGWQIVDELVRQYRPIPQPGGRNQFHARRNYSTLVVARRKP